MTTTMTNKNNCRELMMDELNQIGGGYILKLDNGYCFFINDQDGWFDTFTKAVDVNNKEDCAYKARTWGDGVSSQVITLEDYERIFGHKFEIPQIVQDIMNRG